MLLHSYLSTLDINTTVSTWQGGGKVSSALTAVGQLGGISSMIGMIGADSYGDFLLHDFAYYNVDTSRMIQDGNNAFSVVLSDLQTHGRNILSRPTTSRSYTLEDIDEAFVASHDILHLERADAVSHKLADIIHEAGGLVAFDGDGYSEDTQNMLPKIDIFIGSEFYYGVLFGESEAYEENLEKVRAMRPSIVVFTLGDKGSVVKWEGGYYVAPGYKVAVVDTVGAGDVYHGAYLFAIAKGMAPDESAQFANAVAAIKCTAIGGRAGVPSYEMTIDFMEKGTYDRALIEEKLARYESFSN
ncbi:MAG: carbohydrate kinase family protein [Christensenellaceae bacterium]